MPTTADNQGNEPMSTEHNAEMQALELQLKQALKERDELAARVKMMESAIHKAVMTPVSVDENSAEGEEVQVVRDILGDAVLESGGVSLERQYLEFASLVLGELAKDIKAMHPRATPRGIGAHVEIEAQRYRKQAEGAQ